MELVDTYSAPPACCWLCSFTKQRPDIAIIDTGINVWDPDNLRASQQGRVYFCEECVTNLGRLIGMMTPTEVHDLKMANKRANLEIGRLKGHIKGLRSVKTAVEDFLAQPELSPAESHAIDEPISVP